MYHDGLEDDLTLFLRQLRFFAPPGSKLSLELVRPNSSRFSTFKALSYNGSTSGSFLDFFNDFDLKFHVCFYCFIHMIHA